MRGGSTSQGKVMLDGDEAATDTAVSQFRNSSPILMRPVYLPAILSPCYGLPLCNYILISPAARAPHLFLFASFSPRPLSVVFRLCLRILVPFSLSLSIYVSLLSLTLFRCFTLCIYVTGAIFTHRQTSVMSLYSALCSHYNVDLFTLFGDIVTYPHLIAFLYFTLFVVRSSPAMD